MSAALAKSITLAALLLAAGTTSAQETLFEHQGAQPYDRLGAEVSGLGDLDADGVRDYAVVAPSDSSALPGAGAVYVHSGRSGQLLRRIDGQVADGGLVHARPAGDVDNDGRPDLVVSSVFEWNPGSGLARGSMRVYSGHDFSELHAFFGEAPWTGEPSFGYDIDGAGDVDADGHSDLIVSSWAPPYVDVYSGRTGALLRRHQSHDLFVTPGPSVGAAGDLDADGHADYLFGVTVADFTKYTLGFVVVSGASGQVLREVKGEKGGFATARLVDDVNGDGRADFLFALIPRTADSTTGRVQVYSGRDGAKLLEVGAAPDEPFFGFGADAADVNGDGHADVLVGARYADTAAVDAGTITIFSGRTLNRLYRFEGLAAADQLSAVSRIGDVNGDALADIARGAPGDTSGGKAWVSAGNDLYLNASPRLGDAGKPIELAVRERSAASPALLALTEVGGVSVFVVLAAGSFDAQETFLLTAIVPSGLAGISFVLQAFSQEPGGGVIASGKERVTIRS